MTTSDDIAIRVNHVAKDFYLPHENSNSIKTKIVRLFDKKDRGADIQHALKDVSFEVKKGEFFGIVGRNGGGKSTLLKIIAQIYKPTKGSVEVNGRLVPFIELGVGFNPELTGRENVYLNGALLGFTRQEIDAQYDDIVTFAELEDFMDQKLKNYSSGMQVRLAFSVAIRADSDILILDEVLAVGDEAFQRKCNEYFSKAKREGKTVVLVTHSMESVRHFCDRAVLINSGVVEAEGRPDSVADAYSKMFLPPQEHTDTSSDKRFGTAELTFENIDYDYNDKELVLEFDVVNNTDSEKDGVHLGFDFFSDDQLVIGNGTKYMKQYARGLSFEPSESRYMKVRFPNNFGNFNFSVNFSIRTQGGLNICDEIKPAIEFTSNNTHLAKYFRVISELDIHVDHKA